MRQKPTSLYQHKNFEMERLTMHIVIVWRQLAEGMWRALGCGLSVIILWSGAAFGQTVNTVTTVQSDKNPAGIGQTVLLSAQVSSDILRATFPASVGVSSGQFLYFRYDIKETTFRTAVQGGDLTNLTMPAGIQNATVVTAGSVGSKYVVFQVSAGATGIQVTDQLSFTFAVDRVLPSGAVSFSVHETLSSAALETPSNSTLLFQSSNLLLSGLAPFTVAGVVDFTSNSLAIAGCSAVPIADGKAVCATTFPSAGIYTIVANYSGDTNYFSSIGTLTDGQSVGLAITPSTVAGLSVGQAFSQTFSAVGTAPYVYSSTGTLPPGLALTAAGVLAGTPTTAGTYTFTVRLTDAASATGSVSITSTVAKGSQTITFNTPANAALNSTLALNATASSGLPVVYSISTLTICEAAGNTLRFLAVGICRITPFQSGDGNWFAASSTESTINVVLTGGVKPLRMRSTNGQSISAELSGTNTLFFTSTSDPGPNFRAVAIADLDGNKSPDLIYQNTSAGDPAEVRVWKDFDSSQDRGLRNVKLAWRVDAVGDLDGDGFGDLVWRFTGQTANIDDTGVSYVWFTNGTGVTQVRKRGGAPLNWTLIGAMDLNGDGAADMLYISPTTEIRALMATPGRTCANLSAGFLPTGFTALKVGSFISTGRPEMLIRNSTTGEVRLMIFDGTGLQLPSFTGDPNDPNAACTSSSLNVLSTSIPFALTEPAWTFFGTADFNGDGFLDIVWRREDGIAYVWLTSGSNQPLTGIPNAGLLPNGYTAIQP
jgi:hypothetical protein